MKFKTPTNRSRSEADCRAAVRPPRPGPNGAFTLAEVLAALVFLAIVIPAAVEAMHVAGLAGEVAARKSQAAQIANRILNESIITTNWNQGQLNGTVTEGGQAFRWTLTSQNWQQDLMQRVTAQVSFLAQGHDYSVQLSTLANLQTFNPPTTGVSP